MVAKASSVLEAHIHTHTQNELLVEVPLIQRKKETARLAKKKKETKGHRNEQCL